MRHGVRGDGEGVVREGARTRVRMGERLLLGQM